VAKLRFNPYDCVDVKRFMNEVNAKDATEAEYDTIWEIFENGECPESF